MPQLSQIGAIYLSQLVWLAIVFALIYVVIGKGMVPKIERTIDDRKGRIEGDLSAAEGARAEAAAMQDAYEMSLDGARSNALKIATEAKERATGEAERALHAADAASDAEVDAALVAIDGTKRTALAEVEDATVEAVEAILGKLSGLTVDRAVIAERVKVELAHG